MPIEIAVLGDAEATAEALLAEFDRRGMTAVAGRRSAAMRERIRGGDNHHYPHPDTSGRDFIDPRTLSKAVDAILPADRVVASDSGHFCGWVPRYLRVPNARASCLSHSFQSVGLGLPSVIGLAIANPGKLAVLGTGDGGFLMSMADLETAVRLGLRLCILVYNDSSYAAEVHYFRRQGYSVDIVQFPDTDFAAIARRRARRDGAHAGQSRSAQNMGRRRRTGRVRGRWQDQPEPRSRLARRAFSELIAFRIRYCARRRAPAGSAGHGARSRSR
jgi:thiamine pyrophosphate-dependent acetolactate synthase large subunit-like protein